MPANVPPNKQYPDVTQVQDPVVRNALLQFFNQDQDWTQRAARWINTDAISRLLATNIPVPTNSGSVVITFAVAQPDTSYMVALEATWGTTLAVIKTTTAFTVTFGTASPAGAKLSWALLR